MAWIKRNLWFVGGLAVALVLLGVGVWYFLNRKAAADEVAAELENSATRLDELVSRNPYPNDENIQLAKSEQGRVALFKTNLITRFSSPHHFEKLDVAEFKQLLEGMIHDMEREADRNGVKLPTKYAFTFQDARSRLELDEKKLPALAGQVMDIRELCTAVFRAKIHELVHVKRTPTLKEEMAGPEFTTRKVVSDSVSGMSSYPYEIAFNSFTIELGAALSALANSPLMVVVKTINLERSDSAAPSDVPTMPMMPYGMAPGMNPMMMRYGMGSPFFRGPQQMQPATPPPVNSLRGAILDEKSMRITLGVDIVRPTPKGAAADKPAPRPRAPAAPGAPEEPAAPPPPAQ